MTLLTHVVGWTLVHFLWQGAFLGLATAVALRGCRRRSSQFRYAIACLGLASMAAAPALTSVRLWQASAVDLSRPHPAASGAISASAADPATPEESRSSHASTRSRATGRGGAWLSLVVLGWLAGVLFLLARFAGGWWRVGRLRTVGVIGSTAGWQAVAERLAARLRVGRRFVVTESTIVGAPTVIGWLRPVILLPVGAMVNLTPGQVEAILAHELAHIRRHDYAVNVLQTLVEVVLFYHPAVWWVSARVRAAREHCCDDAAVTLCNEPESYAEALAELASWRAQRIVAVVRATDGSLLARIRRVLDGPEAEEFPSFGGLAALAIGLLVAAGGTVYSAGALAPPLVVHTRASGAASGSLDTNLPRTATVARGETAAAGQSREQAQSPSPGTDGAAGWRVLPTDHFDIHFERALDLHAERMAREAEQAYEKVSADLWHNLAFKIPLVLVRDAAAIERIPPSLLQARPRDSGSVEHLRERILFALDRPVAEWSARIAHEVTHVFTFDILPASSAPAWVFEGLAEHETGAWDPSTLGAVRDAVRAGALPRLEDLSATAATGERQLGDALGQAAFEFIESRWGKAGIRQFLFALRRGGLDAGRAFEAAFQLSAAQFEEQFRQHLARRFAGRAEHAAASREADAASLRVEGEVTTITIAPPPGLACVELLAAGEGELRRRWAIECGPDTDDVLGALKPGDRVIVVGRAREKWGTRRVVLETLLRPRDGLAWPNRQ
jgi:beta-lactamase regulating signal transducer with metallopeptidase domain